MNSLIISTLVLAITTGVAADDPCLVVYRKDLMETWIIPANSSLCNIKNEIFDNDKYGLEAKNGELMITSKGLNTTQSANYVSEKGTEGKIFSITVYRNDSEDPHFVSIQPTSQESKIGKSEHTKTTGLYAHTRSTYYVRHTEISRENNIIKKTMFGFLMAIQSILLICSIFANISRFGCVFNTLLLVSLSHLTAWIKYDSILWFAVTLGVLFLVAFGAGFLNMRAGNRYVSILFGIVMVVYYVVGGSYTNRWFFGVAGSIISIEALLFGCLKLVGSKKERLLYSGQFGLFWIQVYLFWSYSYQIYPAEIYFRCYKGPKDYSLGLPGYGFALWWWSLVNLIGTVILAGICGFMRNHRDRKEAEESVNNKILEL